MFMDSFLSAHVATGTQASAYMQAIPNCPLFGIPIASNKK